MCIVSFIKTTEDSFLLTHNRDEWSERKTSSALIENSSLNLHYPKDQVKGGTWIIDSSRWAACLLNGEKQKHIRKPTYPKSRGLLLFDLVECSSVTEFITHTDFASFECFSLFALHKKNKEFFRLTWDEKKITKEKIDEDITVCSSSTLYSTKEKEYNKTFITSRLNEKPTADELTALHRQLRRQKKDIPSVCTQSITQIQIEKEKSQMRYLVLNDEAK